MTQARQVQLSLVQDAPSGAADHSAVERIFAHWVFMLGKHPVRTKLTPDRRRLIRQWVEVYDEDSLLLAVEGCAGSEWHAGANDRHTAFNDLELILRSARHIERFAEMGENLRRQAQCEEARERARLLQQQDAAVGAATSEALDDQRRRLKALADRMAGRAHG